MSLKKNRKMYIITSIIITTILVIYTLYSINKPYGNDKESIVQVIKSIEGYKTESIEILEITDINDDRLVGFLTNNNPAYIHFTKNLKGNYEWKHIEKSEGQSFASYLIHVVSDESNVLKYMIVTNQENEIAKMEMNVNGQAIEQEFNLNQKNVTWIDLPQANTHTYNFKFFDKAGSLIGEE
ncbi:hypothetical protein ACOI1C_15375 [Bacillus sp. DJP31]|uniref:hypothetical protein n=1 Tax=Bacillus sp. DJP31 TaxID=3409789 RepID=UPI003BB8153C